MRLGRQPTKITPDVALAILAGDKTAGRDEARDRFLRTRSDDELFEWFERVIRALLLRHPKHGALIVEMATSAGKEFGVDPSTVELIERA